MFGYIRPCREELKVRELEDYQAVYCGLCQVMGKRCGFTARMLLNYDFTFLAMLLSQPESRPSTCMCRCPAKLFLRKKCSCVSSPWLEAAADESVILSYWKVRDSIEDGGFWERLGARILSLLLRRGYRRAAVARPEFEREVRFQLEKLHQLEEERTPSLDRTADTFARILQAAAPKTGDETENRALEQLLYHVGRWIYLVDAWDDLQEDVAAGRYNPIHARFGGREEEERDYLRTTLLHSRNLALSAFALLKRGCWEPVLGNILCVGMPMVEELVFRGCWKQMKRQAILGVGAGGARKK